jgi:hypothetical protein
MVAVGSGEDVCVCPSWVVRRKGKVQWIVESCYRKDTPRRDMQICDKVTYNQIQISDKHFPPHPTTSLILMSTLRQSASFLKLPSFLSCSAHQRASKCRSLCLQSLIRRHGVRLLLVPGWRRRLGVVCDCSVTSLVSGISVVSGKCHGNKYGARTSVH